MIGNKMTNKEAIERLQGMRQLYLNITRDDDIDVKACDMAILALELKERYDQFFEDVKAVRKSGKEIEVRHRGRVFRVREVAQ